MTPLRTIATLIACALLSRAATAEIRLPAVYLHFEQQQPPVLSNLDPVPQDEGKAGATLALSDNQTTGRFLGHSYSLDIRQVSLDDDPLKAAAQALSETPFLLLDGPAETLLAIADLPQAANAILFNIRAPDTALRDAFCRANLLHTLPSDAMRADALMQFLLRKRWTKLALIAGDHADDHRWATALRTSATKFGLNIGAAKTWVFDADMRRNAEQEVPLFTQDLGPYDLLLVADELGDFGRYIAYNTWLPRPVAGSEGIVPQAWAPVVEQWGAAQLQSRFIDQSQRPMRPADYAAWAALRTLAEAVTRTNSTDPATLRRFILSPEFELAGFKGRAMSFRNWNGQMRQPIPLVTERAVVAQTPLEGFLHQRTELDTLGLDAPESRCTAFK